MPLQPLQEHLCQVFERWGQPGAFRVDNGEPLGVPNGCAPPALSLWLIGQGVKMIWNKPHCPKQNAKVEKLQDTTRRWAEVESAANTKILQQQLDAKVQLQREQYPVRRLNGQTRLQAYAGLLTNQRPYKPENFQAERVWAFFRQCVYTRRVSSSGVVTHFGVQTSIGAAYKGQWAQVRLSQAGLLWEVLVDDKVVKTYSAEYLSKENLQSLTVYQRAKKKRPNLGRMGDPT